MCGITGLVASDTLAPTERAALSAMRDVLTHRGPDDSGRYVDAHAALGHRRLSVLDLSTGRQPISNENGTIWVVFNGEIYNHRRLRDELIARGHRFATRGDTEVIVHLYEERGDDFLDALHGMFALALWDAPRQRLLLARDRLGVKPLYYHVDARRIVFGSELKSVLEAPGVPHEIDPVALADYLAFGFVPSPRTILRRICKLRPGQCLIYERGRLRLRTWWDLHHRPWRTDSAESLSEELWGTLEAATRDRLVADVPIGVFLSGGVDSTCVAAAAADAFGAAGMLTTCTVGFDNSATDERAAARRLASRLQTRHLEHAVAVRPSELLPRLAWHFDEPFADPSALPFFALCEAVRGDLTVALSGDGGDEALAGYRRYRFDVWEQRIRKLAPGWVRRPLFGTMARLYPDRADLPQPLRARTTLNNLSAGGDSAHARSVARLDAAGVRSLLAPDIATLTRGHDPWEHMRGLYRACDADDHLARCQYVDLRFELADGILTKVDRASMAHGLEVRSPFLDHRLIEFAATIPPALRMHSDHGKRLLREALRRRLGQGPADQHKRGFSVPLDEWFREAAGAARAARGASRSDGGALAARHRAELWERLHAAAALPWLDGAAVRRLAEEHTSGRRNHGPILWSLVMLHAWAAHYSANALRGACDAALYAIPEVTAAPRGAGPLAVGRGSGALPENMSGTAMTAGAATPHVPHATEAR